MIELPIIAAVLIALATTLAAVRVWRSATRWRAALAVAQWFAGGLFWLALFPAVTTSRDGDLTVLTPGATAVQIAAANATSAVALPGVVADPGIERSPDLATALRRHPDTLRLTLVGDGLPARDRDAVRGLSIRFDAAPLPDGFVDIALPDDVLAGQRWRIAGRVQTALASVAVELRDPADRLINRAPIDANGRFVAEGIALAAGDTRHELRVVAVDGHVIDTFAFTVAADDGEPLRLLLLAAVPTPELKYLRRWATDAGIVIDSRIGLTDGVALDSGAAAPIDATLLAKQDVLVVDERRWLQLDDATRRAIVDAVDDGMGLLLRLTGPLSPELLASWSDLGIALTADDAVAPSPRSDDQRDDAIAFTRAGYRLDDGLAPLLTLRDGNAVIGWRGHGQGRIGVTTLLDGWRDVVAGATERHATLWSRLLGTLSRARVDAPPLRPRDARVDERATLCRLAPGGWSVRSPDGESTPLQIDATPQHCAAVWPTEAGTHRLLRNGNAVPGDRNWTFDVQARADTSPLSRAITQQATHDLADGSATATTAAQSPALPPWLPWAGWLLLMTTLWWIERRSRTKATH